jgi:hypothetical protein
MANTQPVTEALADLQTGVVRTLATICRQLIEARVLDRDLLVASLKETGAALTLEKVGFAGISVPVALIAALGQNASRQP